MSDPYQLMGPVSMPDTSSGSRSNSDAPKREEVAPEFRYMQVDQSSPLSLKGSSVNSRENLRYQESHEVSDEDQVKIEENKVE